MESAPYSSHFHLDLRFCEPGPAEEKYRRDRVCHSVPSVSSERFGFSTGLNTSLRSVYKLPSTSLAHHLLMGHVHSKGADFQYFFVRNITQYLKLSKLKCAPAPVREPNTVPFRLFTLASTHPLEPTWSHYANWRGGELACSSGTVTLAVCKCELSRPDASLFASTLSSLLENTLPIRSPSSSTVRTLFRCSYRSHPTRHQWWCVAEHDLQDGVRMWSMAKWSCLHPHQFTSAAYASR